jgi:hypothetical protein
MKKKALITSMALLLVAIVCLSTATYAWFTSGASVSASGMQVTAKAGSLLVISNSATAQNTTSTEITVTDNVLHTLNPATLVSGALKTLTQEDYAKIDKDTGKVKSGETLTYKAATSGTDYVDYVVYLASAGDAITAADGKTLTATVTFASPASSQETMKATTVQLLHGSTVLGSTVASNNSNIVVNSGVAIGSAGGSADYTVTIRIYIDGALQSTASPTANYVRSSNVDVQNLGITVAFSVEDAA